MALLLIRAWFVAMQQITIKIKQLLILFVAFMQKLRIMTTSEGEGKADTIPNSKNKGLHI